MQEHTHLSDSFGAMRSLFSIAPAEKPIEYAHRTRAGILRGPAQALCIIALNPDDLDMTRRGS